MKLYYQFQLSLLYIVTDPCASSNCAVDAVCVSTGTDTFQCICQKGFIGDGRTCEGRQLVASIFVGLL